MCIQFLIRSSFHIQGVIDLRLCTEVVDSEPVKGHKFVFDVCTSERVYHLDAESAEQKEKWVTALCQLLFGEDQQRQPTNPTLPYSCKEECVIYVTDRYSEYTRECFLFV